jgi:hypothetical protein
VDNIFVQLPNRGGLPFGASRNNQKSLPPLLTYCRGQITYRFDQAAHKKTDVSEHPQVFRHIGLLFNKPPGIPRLLSIQSSETMIGKDQSTLCPLQYYAIEFEKESQVFS